MAGATPTCPSSGLPGIVASVVYHAPVTLQWAVSGMTYVYQVYDVRIQTEWTSGGGAFRRVLETYVAP